VHPSELAHANRAHFNRKSGEPTLEPGSIDEEIALEEIDRLRHEEMKHYGETFEARRRRFAKKLHNVGLDPREIGRG
jgi:hypothetical protein